MKKNQFYVNVPDATDFLFDIGVESGFEISQYIILIFVNHNVNEQTDDSN